MLPVYLCEDETHMLQLEKKLIEQYILIQNYDMNLAVYTGNPKEILEVVKQNPKRGIYFLDVDLKGEMDGFQLGKEIRKYDTYGFVVYVTSFRELAYKTFQHHIEVLDYIVKDSREEVERGIRECLDTIVERMNHESFAPAKACYTVKSGDSQKHIPVEDILFFETARGSHRITLHTAHGSIGFVGQMKEIESELPEYFFRCHRAYLVNLKQVQEMNLKSNEVIVANGEVCLMTRGTRAEMAKRLSMLFGQ